MLLKNDQAIYCWKAQYLISKIMDNIAMYPGRIRMMTRSKQVTHKMTIIGKFTMPRILWSYINCVSTSQLLTSHILYERSVSRSRNVVWHGTVKWGSFCWAAFKQGHCKLMNVRNCAIPHTLHIFWLLTSASPTYLWTYHIPLESIVYPCDNEVHSRTIKWCIRSVKVKQVHYQRIYIQKCYNVFVNVRNATSYAIGKSLHPGQIGYYIGLFFIELQLHCDHMFLQSELFVFLFAKYSFITKYCMLSRFDNATWNVLSMFFLFTVIVVTNTLNVFVDC